MLDKSTNTVTGVKLIDFGMSCKKSNAKKYFDEHSIGTKGYVAPEVFHKNTDRYDQIDSWALGVVLYNLICGKMPFEGKKEKVK